MRPRPRQTAAATWRSTLLIAHDSVASCVATDSNQATHRVCSSTDPTLQEHIAKNEFVGEYTGEVIDQMEAERRGKAYDRCAAHVLVDMLLMKWPKWSLWLQHWLRHEGSVCMSTMGADGWAWRHGGRGSHSTSWRLGTGARLLEGVLGAAVEPCCM